MRKALIVTLFVFMIAATADTSSAASFGSNSADINNAYLFTGNGSQLITGFGSKVFQYEYVHNIGTEFVDGVKCIRAISVSTQPGEFTEYWIAQDRVGDIYLLKYWSGDALEPVVLGKARAELMMRRNPQVGDMILRDKTVIETGVTVIQLPSGLGPFKDCIKTRGPGGDVTWYARNVGMVKKQFPGGRSGWFLKEVLSASKKGPLVPEAPSKLKINQ